MRMMIPRHKAVVNTSHNMCMTIVTLSLMLANKAIMSIAAGITEEMFIQEHITAEEKT